MACSLEELATAARCLACAAWPLTDWLASCCVGVNAPSSDGVSRQHSYMRQTTLFCICGISRHSYLYKHEVAMSPRWHTKNKTPLSCTSLILYVHAQHMCTLTPPVKPNGLMQTLSWVRVNPL